IVVSVPRPPVSILRPRSVVVVVPPAGLGPPPCVFDVVATGRPRKVVETGSGLGEVVDAPPRGARVTRPVSTAAGREGACGRPAPRSVSTIRAAAVRSTGAPLFF